MPPLTSPLAFGLTGGLPPWVPYLNQADFLNMVGRLLPPEYLAPLFSPGPGGEIYFAQTAIGFRVSLAIANYQAASYIGTAPDGGFAEAPVTFSRPTATAGAVTVKAGTVVQSATYGRQFALMADVAFGAADLSASGIVQALFQGEQWNVRGPYTTAAGEVVPGEINQVVMWILSPAYGDATITVAQASDAVGGQSSVLVQHGADRGFTRAVNEPTNTFRHRIQTLPDTVSPLAIQHLLASYAAAYPGTTWDFIETFQSTYQEAFDCPSPNLGTPTYQATIPASIDTNLFVYDDPRPAYPFRNRWLDENDFRGAFIVVVPNLPALTDVGMAYDDTAVSPSALLTAYGYRSVSAYDVPSGYSASSPGGYDGFDLAKQSVYRGLYASLQQVKAAGIFFAVELQGM